MEIGGLTGGHVLCQPQTLVLHSDRVPYPEPATLIRYWVLKRAFDILVVLAVSPVLIPVLLLIALAVRINSPGSIFFSHRRLRGHGSFFTMWKFRTMCMNAQEVLDRHLEDHPELREEWRRSHKLKDDPRITGVGSFLRRRSLDELPQLWNVFTGSMSLVGPRPIVAAEMQKYGDGFSIYCKVKPGITGLWQVSGRSRTSYQERVQLDCLYVQQWSLSGDLLILLRTLVAVWNQDGAY
jgi:Undecaprenyl-phosphate galactose phosphotransferase WbaP